ncbi:MAG: hypothetical protein ACK5HY_07965 [Parahaliea sp.]
MSNIFKAISLAYANGGPVPSFRYPIVLDEAIWNLMENPGSPSPRQIIQSAAEAVNLKTGENDSSAHVDFSINVRGNRGNLPLRVSLTPECYITIVPVPPETEAPSGRDSNGQTPVLERRTLENRRLRLEIRQILKDSRRWRFEYALKVGTAVGTIIAVIAVSIVEIMANLEV